MKKGCFCTNLTTQQQTIPRIKQYTYCLQNRCSGTRALPRSEEPLSVTVEGDPVSVGFFVRKGDGADSPRYVMGVGTPVNILESIALGIDMFDCVMPTRNARHGLLYTREGVINIKNEKWKKDFSAIDPEGTSFVDSFYSKAYLRHLIQSQEMLAGMIASLHNLAFYLWLVGEARNKIMDGTFLAWKDKMVKQLDRRL